MKERRNRMKSIISKVVMCLFDYALAPVYSPESGVYRIRANDSEF